MNCWYHVLLCAFFFQIVTEKQKFRKNPVNYAFKKTELLKHKVSAWWLSHPGLQRVTWWRRHIDLTPELKCDCHFDLGLDLELEFSRSNNWFVMSQWSYHDTLTIPWSVGFVASKTETRQPQLQYYFELRILHRSFAVMVAMYRGPRPVSKLSQAFWFSTLERKAKEDLVWMCEDWCQNVWPSWHWPTGQRCM